MSLLHLQVIEQKQSKQEQEWNKSVRLDNKLLNCVASEYLTMELVNEDCGMWRRVVR